jgi:hypothetical protein
MQNGDRFVAMEEENSTKERYQLKTDNSLALMYAKQIIMDKTENSGFRFSLSVHNAVPKKHDMDDYFRRRLYVELGRFASFSGASPNLSVFRKANRAAIFSMRPCKTGARQKVRLEHSLPNRQTRGVGILL